MTISIDLSGKGVVVTGAGSGIGAETSRLLARAGAAVACVDVNRAAAERVADEIGVTGGRAEPIELDVRDASACHQALADAPPFPIDLAVNGAATWTLGNFVDQDPSTWSRDLDITLMGTMHVTHALLPEMIRRGHGAIVNISSDAARVGERHEVLYAAAKAGVIGFTKALALEVGRAGVRVNCVAPGMTRTPASEDFVGQMTDEKIRRAYPLGRIGEPIDIANALLFLLSDLSAWVTGQVLSVSGGYTTVG